MSKVKKESKVKDIRPSDLRPLISSGTPVPPLVVHGNDRRSRMYETIAKVHKQIVEAKWKARTVGTQMQISPMLMLHHEDSLAFLAEEVLRLTEMVEGQGGEE